MIAEEEKKIAAENHTKQGDPTLKTKPTWQKTKAKTRNQGPATIARREGILLGVAFN